MQKLLVLLSFCAFAIPSAQAVTPQQESLDYDELSQIPAKYEVIGTVCEYLTALRLRDQYPVDRFQIEVGIEYRIRGRVIGEIDVVIFRRSDMEAVAVGQVKCRHSMQRASHDAREQNERFEDAMGRIYDTPTEAVFRSTSKSGLRVLNSNMDEVTTFITASQDGGEEYGFDMTIGYDLDAAMALRQRLISCQSAGDCPRPL